MNKIYKVIWSKVKNQYVVVSELAHSSGKQSRTSRSNIRSRIAALVVCGAIAAFGVLPMDSVSAQYNTEELPQYVVATDNIGNGDGITITTEDHPYDASWKDHHYEKISINTGDGLSIDKNNNVVIDLASGKGLDFYPTRDVYDKDGNLIATKGQIGIKLSTNEEGYDNSGLITDDNGLKINNGDTLKIDGNKLDVKLADNSLTTETNGQKGLKVNVQEGSGLTAKDIQNRPQGLKVETGNGLKIDSNAVAVDVRNNSGLIADTTNGLAIKLDKGNDISKNTSGLTVTNSGLKVNAGDGLSTESGQLAVKLAKTNSKDNSGLTVDTNGLKINNGDTLKIEGNELDVNLASNSGLDTTGGLAIKLDKGSDNSKNISGLTVTSNGLKVNAGNGLTTENTDGKLAVKLANGNSGLEFDTNGGLKVNTSSLKIDGAVVHSNNQYNKDSNGNSIYSLKDTNANIRNDYSNLYPKKNVSSSIALGDNAEVVEQNGNKTQSILFANQNDTYTGGIAIGQDTTALNGTVNIGVKDYAGKMGDVNVSAGKHSTANGTKDNYNTYTATSTGETSIGSNSYTSGMLSTNLGSYNIVTTSYGNFEPNSHDYDGWFMGDKLNEAANKLIKQQLAAQNFGSVVVGTLNSIESASSEIKYEYGTVTSGANVGIANSVIGMANKTQNSNGSLVFGTGNEITNSIDTIPTPSSFGGSVSETADSFRDAVSTGSNGGAVLAIGGGNKADYAVNSQLIGVQNKIIGKKGAVSQYNMVDGYRNTVKGSNDTVIGVNNDVTGNKNIVLGDNRTVGTGQTDADNNIILGSSDTGISGLGDKTYDHKASDTVVIGHNAKAEADNSVAIGSGSVAGKAYGDKNFDLSLSEYAGHNPVGTVSVGNEYQKRTITNVAAGRLNAKSTDAVNGSQLYKTNEQVGSLDEQVSSLETTVNNGWTATDGKGGRIQVTPTDNTLQFNGDRNIDVTAANGAINVKLNPVVKLDGNKHDGDGILLNGESGSIHAVNTQAAGIVGPLGGIAGVASTNKFDFDNDGAKFEAKVSGTIGHIADNVTLSTTKTTKFDENGATFVNKKEAKRTILGQTVGKLTDVSFTNIDGGVVTTDKVQGLDNTKWDDGLANAVDKSKRLQGMAATQGQLRDVDIKVNKNTHDIDDLQDQVKEAGQGWTAKASGNGKTIDVTPGKTLNFNGDKNIDVTATGNTINVGLKPVVTLDNNYNDNEVVLNGNAGTISAENSKESGIWIKGSKTTNTFDFDNGGKFETTKSDIIFGVPVNSVTHTAEFNEDGATFTKEKGRWQSSTNIDGGVVTTDIVKGLNNTKWDDKLADAVDKDKRLQGIAATQGQLEDVDDKVNKNATDIDALEKSDALSVKYDSKTKDIVTLGGLNSDGTPQVNGGVKLTNVKYATGTDDSEAVNVGYFKDNVSTYNNLKINGTVSDEHKNGGNWTIEDSKQNVKFTNTILDENKSGMASQTAYGQAYQVVDTDGNVVSIGDIASATKLQSIDTDKIGDLKYLNDREENIVKNSDSLTKSIGKLDAAIEKTNQTVNEGWYVADKNTSSDKNGNFAVKPGDTLKFNGDDNIDVTATDGAINVKLKDNITLDGEAGHINFNPYNENSMISIKDTTGNAVFNVAKDGTVSSAGNISSKGDVTAGDGAYSLTELGKYAVKYDETAFDSGTPKITLAGPNGTTIANVADAKNPDEAVNLRQLKDVEATASAGWTAKAGNDTITVKPNQTLNFEGDGNITVSATSGTSSELKFGLNDTIVLGDAVPTEEGGSAASLALSSDGSYVPPTASDADKSETGIIGSHGGGFILYSTNSAGNPMFGVTADGVVHAKDVISYYDDDNNPTTPSNIKYSLNDVGDIVTQIAHGQYDKTGMEYTLISDFKNETDKEDPFEALPDKEGETAERTIGLAVRQDGAVVVGAVVNQSGVLKDSGIRINDGEATITGLENTEWKPKAPGQTPQAKMATFNGETTTTETSRAATEAQLDDLYDSVVGYNVDENGSVNPNHVTLKGEEKYTFTTDANGTKTYSGGVKLDNVAYAVTDTASKEYNGSAAVNVDLLKDTVANVTSQPIESDRYLTGGKLDGNTLNLTVANTQQPVSITGIASTGDIDTINQTIEGINQTITEINDTIKGITTGGTGTGGNNNTDITGGHVDKETGDIVLEKGEGDNKSEVTVGQLTDSVVDSAEFKDGTLTITSKDKYSKEETSSVKVEGIASTEVVGATSKEDLKEKYKDADTAYITDSETMVDADIALDHAVQDLASNDQYLNSRIDSVEKRLGDVEQRIDKVGAMAAAIANLRTMGFDPEAPTEIAVGVGQYKSETGLAIGVFHYPNQDFMLSASLSTSGDEVMGGIGATWRIGRKTAAEKAKDEEKRILAKAEEIKQAAKRAEVKAQADRHAKLLAEREAKGESIRPIENKVEQTQEQA